MPDKRTYAQAHAEEYKTQQEASALNPGAKPAPRTPEQWQDLISQRIEEAMQQGAFDNLPGKGKPLDPAPNPFVPPDMQMANSLLKSNDLAPAWISDRNAMLTAIERFRSTLRRTTAEFDQARQNAATPEERSLLEQQWQRQIHIWQQEVIDLNKRIQVQNLKQPVAWLEIFPLRLEDEMRKAEWLMVMVNG